MDSLKGRFLRSGELARLTGVSKDTLRHYERLGLLPPPHRLPNGYREYSPNAVDRIRIIQGALSIGFTLDELVQIFRARAGGEAPCRRVRDIAQAKLDDIESWMSKLITVRDELRSILGDWDQRLEKTPPGEPAGLLGRLPASSLPRKERPLQLAPRRAARKK